MEFGSVIAIPKGKLPLIREVLSVVGLQYERVLLEVLHYIIVKEYGIIAYLYLVVCLLFVRKVTRP